MFSGLIPDLGWSLFFSLIYANAGISQKQLSPIRAMEKMFDKSG
jgi:hypothetical protein